MEKMKQVFLLGSSNVYGVGSPSGSWGDMIKRDFHKLMYGEQGIGEQFEVYNFGKSGATSDFVLETFPVQLEQFGRGGDIAAVVSVGGNDSKAVGELGNFVSTPEEYGERMKRLFAMMREQCGKIIALAGGYYDETKTNPRVSESFGGKVYFSNDRRLLFQKQLEFVCKDMGVEFIGIDIGVAEWVDRYTYIDGLHPNEAGYRLIADKVKASLWKYFGI